MKAVKWAAIAFFAAELIACAAYVLGQYLSH